MIAGVAGMDADAMSLQPQRAYRVLHLKTLVAFDHTPWTDKSPGWVHAGLARVRFDLDQLKGGEQRIAFHQSFDVAMRSSQPHWVFKPFAKDPPNDKSPALGNSRAGLFAGILRVGRLTPLSPTTRFIPHPERSPSQSATALIYIKGFLSGVAQLIRRSCVYFG